MCRACAADVECAPGVCDVASDAEQGACVGCNVDAQCGEGMICTPAHACGACAATSGCDNPAPVCDTDSSTCRGCASDADCAGNTAGPVCATQGPLAGSCVVGDASTDDAGVGAGGAGASGDRGGGCTVATTARSPRGYAALLVGALLVARRRRRMRR
jgi:MYXO-CTERM domain-containing protein